MITVGFGPSFPARATTSKPGRTASYHSSQRVQHTGQDRFSGSKSGNKKDEVPIYIPAAKVEETKEKIAESERPFNAKQKAGIALYAAGTGVLVAGMPFLGVPIQATAGTLYGQALKEKGELGELKEALDKKLK